MAIDLQTAQEERAKTPEADKAISVPPDASEECPAPTTEYGILQRTLTPDEWIAEARTFAESNRDWPVLPGEAFERESIYADHD